MGIASSLLQGVRMGRHRTPQVQTLFSSGLWLLCLVLGSAVGLAGQQSAVSIQGSPVCSQSPQQGPPSSHTGTTNVFIGYATNGSFVFPDIATSPGPLTTAGKFKLFVNQSISPPYILESGIQRCGAVRHEIPLSPILRNKEFSRFLVTGTVQK